MQTKQVVIPVTMHTDLRMRAATEGVAMTDILQKIIAAYLETKPKKNGKRA